MDHVYVEKRSSSVSRCSEYDYLDACPDSPMKINKRNDRENKELYSPVTKILEMGKSDQITRLNEIQDSAKRSRLEHNTPESHISARR